MLLGLMLALLFFTLVFHLLVYLKHQNSKIGKTLLNSFLTLLFLTTLLPTILYLVSIVHNLISSYIGTPLNLYSDYSPQSLFQSWLTFRPGDYIESAFNNITGTLVTSFKLGDNLENQQLILNGINQVKSGNWVNVLDVFVQPILGNKVNLSDPEREFTGWINILIIMSFILLVSYSQFAFLGAMITFIFRKIYETLINVWQGFTNPIQLEDNRFGNNITLPLINLLSLFIFSLVIMGVTTFITYVASQISKISTRGVIGPVLTIFINFMSYMVIVYITQNVGQKLKATYGFNFWLKVVNPLIFIKFIVSPKKSLVQGIDNLNKRGQVLQDSILRGFDSVRNTSAKLSSLKQRRKAQIEQKNNAQSTPIVNDVKVTVNLPDKNGTIDSPENISAISESLKENSNSYIDKGLEKMYSQLRELIDKTK